MAIAKKTRKASAQSAAKNPAAGKTPAVTAPELDAPPTAADAPAAPTARKGKQPKTKAGKVAADGDDDGNARSTPLGLDIDAEVLEFIEAIDRFKKANGRPFPSWSEVLFVLKELGYSKR